MMHTHPQFGTVHVRKLYLLYVIDSFPGCSLHGRVSEILLAGHRDVLASLHLWMLIKQKPLNISVSQLMRVFPQLAPHGAEYAENVFAINWLCSWKTYSKCSLQPYKFTSRVHTPLRDELQQFACVNADCTLEAITQTSLAPAELTL